MGILIYQNSPFLNLIHNYLAGAINSTNFVAKLILLKGKFVNYRFSYKTTNLKNYSEIGGFIYS